MIERADEARHQREQMERYLAWVREEGGVEGPTHLATYFRSEQQQRLAWIKERCEGSVMEVGCGYGYVLAYCGGVVGVDTNPRSLALAQILNPTKVFIEGDMRKLPLPDNYVDTVLFPDCIEHIPWEDVPKALAEGRRVARKKLLITMPNAEYVTKTSAVFKHRFLLTQTKFEELLNILGPDQVSYERNYFWVLMEVRCETGEALGRGGALLPGGPGSGQR